MLLQVSSTMCSSSGGQNCIIQHLVLSYTVGGRPVHGLREDCAPDGHLQGVMIPDAVYYNSDLMMSTTVLEKCRGI